MTPIVALVGRPNVGKSTLFNQLTGSREALVHDRPGVTRDRMYGAAEHDGQRFHIVDTGGLEQDDVLSPQVLEQVEQLLRESHAVVFVVDCRDGLCRADEDIADRLRRLTIPIIVAVNKAEGRVPDSACAEFQSLGLGDPIAISARKGRGIGLLWERLLPQFDAAGDTRGLTEEDDDPPRVAVLGRPNVGKSTLINALVGESRLVVSDVPGTTRDSVDVTISRRDRTYILVDTAGIRKRSKTKDDLERLTVVRSLGALDRANVVVFVIDSQQGVLEQDATLAGLIEQSGRSCVVAMNKWDGLSRAERNHLRREAKRRLPFFKHLDFIPVSALHGSGLGDLMDSVDAAYASAMTRFGTSDLNRRFKQALEIQAPPLHAGRAVRLKYAHQGGRNPPTVVVHGNQIEHVPDSYRRYLSNYFSRSYRLAGTRVRILFRSAGNPYDAQH